MIFPEKWAIPYARAEGFFRGQDDVEEVAPGRFRFGAWEVEVTEMPDEVIGADQVIGGFIVLPCSKVIFSGDGPDVKEIRHRFMIYYLAKGKIKS